MILLIFKTLVFTLLIPGTVAVVLPLMIAEHVSIDGIFSIISGSVFMSLGLALYLWCVWDFIVFGKGTPAPIDSPKHLVIRGLYHYSRNPMYVAVLSFIIGWGLLFNLAILFAYAAGVASWFQLMILFYEEPILQKTFAEEYSNYKASVNRWLPML
ncbi:MAG: isoprenylcysteine carboxylmethyltransferase family protein [Methyloprofundus sp.]|nr:isoprenylcysteine carboxylmethyltransferase family protein [Methyloprofundus sp.]